MNPLSPKTEKEEVSSLGETRLPLSPDQEKLARVEARIQGLYDSQMLLSGCLRKTGPTNEVKLTNEERAILQFRFPGVPISHITPKEITTSIQAVSAELSELDQAKDMLKKNIASSVSLEQNTQSKKRVSEELSPELGEPVESESKKGRSDITRNLPPEIWGEVIRHAEGPREKRKIAAVNKSARESALIDFKKQSLSVANQVFDVQIKTLEEYLAHVERAEKELGRVPTEQEKTSFDDKSKILHAALEDLSNAQKTFEEGLEQALTVQTAQECIDRLKFQLAESVLRKIPDLRAFHLDLEKVPQFKGKAKDFFLEVQAIRDVLMKREELIQAAGSQDEENIEKQIREIRSDLVNLFDHVRSFSISREILDSLHEHLSSKDFSYLITFMYGTHPGADKEIRKQVAEYCLTAFGEAGALWIYLDRSPLDEKLRYLEQLNQLVSEQKISSGSLESIHNMLMSMAKKCMEEHRFSDLVDVFSVEAQAVLKSEELKTERSGFSSSLRWNVVWCECLQHVTEREETQILSAFFSKYTEIERVCGNTAVRQIIHESFIHIYLSHLDIQNAWKYAQGMIWTGFVENEFQSALHKYVFGSGLIPVLNHDNLKHVLGLIRDLHSNLATLWILGTFIEKSLILAYQITKDPILLDVILKGADEIQHFPSFTGPVLQHQIIQNAIVPYVSDEGEYRSHENKYMNTIARMFEWIRTLPSGFIKEKGLVSVAQETYRMFKATQKPELLERALNMVDGLSGLCSSENSSVLLSVALPYALDREEGEAHFGRYVDTCHRLFQKIDVAHIPQERAVEIKKQFETVYASMKDTMGISKIGEQQEEHFHMQMDHLKALIQKVGARVQEGGSPLNELD